MDFLHCCDLGVTADWHGCLLFYIQQQKIAGVFMRVRCAKLFQDIQQFYKENKVQDRLPKLLSTMLRREVKGKKKVPKLRVKAGESRALVPCCLQLATQHMDASIPHESAMLQGCKRLDAMYTCLSSANWDADKPTSSSAQTGHVKCIAPGSGLQRFLLAMDKTQDGVK